jgi:hypothetical protein
MNKKDKKRHDNIARLGCVLCYYLGINDTPAELHHVRRFGGKRSAAPILPLCTEHHRGSTGVHGLGAKAFERHYEVEFDTLIEIVERRLNE